MLDPFWIFEGILAAGAAFVAVHLWRERERMLSVGAFICCGFACYIIVYAATHQ